MNVNQARPPSALTEFVPSLPQQRPVPASTVATTPPHFALELPDGAPPVNADYALPSSQGSELQQRQAMTHAVQTRIQTFSAHMDAAARDMFKELAGLLLMKGGNLLDRGYHQAIRKDPSLVDTALRHLSRVQRDLARAGVTPQGLKDSLSMMSLIDGGTQFIQGAIDAIGFGLIGASLNPFAARVAPKLHGPAQDAKLAAALVGYGALPLMLGNRLTGELAAGVTTYSPLHRTLTSDNVADGLSDLMKAHQYSDAQGIVPSAAAVTTAYNGKNIARFALNFGVEHSNLTPETSAWVRDICGDALPSMIAGGFIPPLRESFFDGREGHPQAVLLNTNAAKNIADVHNTYVNASALQLGTNITRNGFNAAARMTWGVMEKAVHELMPLRWTGNVLPYAAAVVQGGERPPMNLGKLGHWVPPILLKMVSMQALLETITIGGYVAAIAYMSNGVDAYAKDKGWNDTQRNAVKEMLKPVIASLSYFTIITASCVAKIGDKAAARLLSRAYQGIKSYFGGSDAAGSPPLAANSPGSRARTQMSTTPAAASTPPTDIRTTPTHAASP